MQTNQRKAEVIIKPSGSLVEKCKSLCVVIIKPTGQGCPCERRPKHGHVVLVLAHRGVEGDYILLCTYNRVTNAFLIFSAGIHQSKVIGGVHIYHS